jgi:hypothetical protein
MSATITLRIFSGLPNPTWRLTDEEEQQLIARLMSPKAFTNRRPSGIFGGLGYRGFSIDRIDDRQGRLRAVVHERIIESGAAFPNVIDDTELERWLAQTAQRHIPDDVLRHLDEQVQRGRTTETFRFPSDAPPSCPRCNAAGAPAYEPERWNVFDFFLHNNCYDWANNFMTNSYSQPGAASSENGIGVKIMACPNVAAGAAADGLRPASGFADPLGGDEWYVALAIWPGRDYHWYRQDNVGCWSHKPGPDLVRNVDNSGNPIADPSSQSCDRGPYTEFCGYMVTHRNIAISGDPDEEGY